jgi:hypothetical protein
MRWVSPPERVLGNAVEGKVAQGQFDHKFQAVVYFQQQPFGNLPVVFAEFEG